MDDRPLELACENLEVARPPWPPRAPREASGARRGDAHDLAALPGEHDVGVVVPVVDEVMPLEHDHLEVSVNDAAGALDDRPRPTRLRRDRLSALPRQAYVRVVVPVVDEIRAFEHDHLEVAVVVAAEVGLDDAAGA